MSGPAPRPGVLKKDLQWGQTPWDDMSREELLFEVRRMFPALLSCKSALALLRYNDRGSTFWAPDGTGGDAIRKAEIALEGLDYPDEFSERIYRCFYRYAVDLLFGPELGFSWRVCDSCGDMWGGDGDKKAWDSCINQTCAGFGKPLRRLNWSDMKTEPSDGPAAEANSGDDAAHDAPDAG